MAFEVIWYYTYEKSRSVNPYNDLDTTNVIRGITFSGGVVNSYYNPSVVFQYGFEIDKKFSRANVNVGKPPEEPCGDFEWNGTRCLVTVCSEGIFHFRSQTPVTSVSRLFFNLENEMDIEPIVGLIYALMSLMRYISLNRNISFGDIATFDLLEDGTRYAVGGIFIVDRTNDEKYLKTKMIIGHQILGNRMANLLVAFINKKVYSGFVSKSISSANSFENSGIILLLAGFDFEYEQSYPEKISMSNEYIEVKKEVMDEIDKLRLRYIGKKREHARNFKKYVENHSNSFSDRLNYAIDQNMDVLDRFLRRDLGSAYKTDVWQVCKQMNALRNNIAHGRLDFALNGLDLIGLVTVRNLLYSMKLRSIGIEADAIKKAINGLMDYGFA